MILLQLLKVICISYSSVLSSLKDDIKDVSVTVGEPATILCKILKRDTNYSISWKIGEEKYSCNVINGDSTNIHCSTNDTHSVLNVDNTNLLGAGMYSVQCILQQMIPSLFLEDSSFLYEFRHDITKTATLMIMNNTNDSGEYNYTSLVPVVGRVKIW